MSKIVETTTGEVLMEILGHINRYEMLDWLDLYEEEDCETLVDEDGNVTDYYYDNLDVVDDDWVWVKSIGEWVDPADAERKPLARIDTEIGKATIYYNGAGEEMTAEMLDGEKIESIPCQPPRNIDEAVDNIVYLYSDTRWNLERIEWSLAWLK